MILMVGNRGRSARTPCCRRARTPPEGQGGRRLPLRGDYHHDAHTRGGMRGDPV